MTEQLIYIAVMAVITYLIRVLPITVFRKEITSQWLTSFLYYVPYAVLGAMTFPAVFTSGGALIPCSYFYGRNACGTCSCIF